MRHIQHICQKVSCVWPGQRACAGRRVAGCAVRCVLSHEVCVCLTHSLSDGSDCSVYASLWIAMCVLALCAHPCTWLQCLRSSVVSVAVSIC